MPDSSAKVTIFRSADNDAEEDARDLRERLEQAGISAQVVDDDTPGVVVGTWEVRVAAADRARAEAIASAPEPEEEDEVDIPEEALTHDLDFVAVYSGQGAEAEMEAISIRSVLEANGIPCVVIGSQQIPSLPFEVRVPMSRLEEARSVLEEIREAD